MLPLLYSVTITNAFNLVYSIATLLAPLSIGTEIKLFCNSFKLVTTSQSLIEALILLEIIWF